MTTTMQPPAMQPPAILGTGCKARIAQTVSKYRKMERGAHHLLPSPTAQRTTTRTSRQLVRQSHECVHSHMMLIRPFFFLVYQGRKQNISGPINSWGPISVVFFNLGTQICNSLLLAWHPICIAFYYSSTPYGYTCTTRCWPSSISTAETADLPFWSLTLALSGCSGRVQWYLI